MKEEKRILELTDFEWRLLVECLNTARSKYIDECKLTNLWGIIICHV